jgi:mycofactocin precursor peptide peptidase
MGLRVSAVLATAVWPDVAAADRRALVVPIGSCEQHGPHLPLDTDTRIATAVALGVVETTAGSHLGPSLPIGASAEHGDFPGTLSIGSTALELLVVELVRDASRHWPCVLLVNGHGGNVEALGRACDLLEHEGRRCRAWTASWRDGDAHAGRTETSLMLAIEPSSVRVAAAAAGVTTSIDVLLPALRERGVRSISPNGVLGDPAGASESGGRTILAGMVASCTSALAALMSVTAGRDGRSVRA